MSALLSPPKPVRTRFKVPGEGAYELNADIPPPNPRLYAATQSPPQPASPQPKPSPTPSFSAASLGLPKVTKLSFAAIHLSSKPPSPAPVDPPTSLFSFRKFASLTNLTGKSVPDDNPSLTSNSPVSNSRAEQVVLPPPRVATRRNTPPDNLPPPTAVLAYNASDSLILLDVSRTTEQLLVLHPRAPPTAHALSATDTLRLLVGHANGELLYYPDVAPDPRRMPSPTLSPSAPSTPNHLVYNKDGTLNTSRIVDVAWVPPSSMRFISVHVDGGLVVYDAQYKPTGTRTAALEELPSPPARPSPRPDDRPERDRERERSGLSAGSDKQAPSHRRAGSAAAVCPGLHEITVNRNVKGKRNNSATVWQIGRAALTACHFSPVATSDSIILALTGRDGYLRIVDFVKEMPLISFRSYFGAFLCVAWSPDGKYVATGGEDDLVSIFCPEERRLVARLEGHTSWVSAVAWDTALSLLPGRYRIGSAGQDAKLLLWDFSLDVLHHRSSHRPSGSVVRIRSYRCDSSPSGNNGLPNGTAGGIERKGSKLSRLRGHGVTNEPGTSATTVPTVVPAPGRAEVPVVEPVVAHVAHGEPLTDVWFQDCGIFTADAVGGIKMWSRPPQHSVPEISLGRGGVRAAGTDLD